MKILSQAYHKNKEDVYPLSVDDFERKCFRLLSSGRWHRHPLHRSRHPAMWWMVHVALQTTSSTFTSNSSTFCVKTKQLKWCYYHVNLYIDFLITSRSTKDQIFLMNNIPKQKRKQKHNNLVKCLEPHYINNNIGFILGSKHSICWVHKPTWLKIKFKPSQSFEMYSPHLLCSVSRYENIYINATEFKRIFAH